MRFESRIEQYAPPGGIPSSGSAILLDLGAHVVNQALLLFGPVVSAYAELDDAGEFPEPGLCSASVDSDSGDQRQAAAIRDSTVRFGRAACVQIRQQTAVSHGRSRRLSN